MWAKAAWECTWSCWTIVMSMTLRVATVLDMNSGCGLKKHCRGRNWLIWLWLGPASKFYQIVHTQVSSRSHGKTKKVCFQ
jgi:hypothetical protein